MQRRAARIAEADGAARDLINGGRLEDALKSIDSALQELGEVEELGRLRDRILEGLRQESRDRLLEEAGGHVAGGRLDRAVTVLEQAHTLDPSSTLVAARPTEARQARDRARRVTEEVAGIEALLDQDAVDDALNRVTQAITDLGAEDQLTSLRTRIVNRQNELLAASVAAQVTEAEELLGRGDPAGAIALLEQAREISPDSTVVGQRLEEARNREQQLELEQQRLARVDEAVSAIEVLVAADMLAEARSQVETALKEHGDAERLQSLHARILQIGESQRSEAVDALLREAEHLASEGDLVAAVSRLEEALDLDTGNRVVQARLAEARKTAERGLPDPTESIAVKDQATVLGPLPEGGAEHTVAMARPVSEDVGPTEDRTRAMELPEADEHTTAIDRSQLGAEDRTTAIDPSELGSPSSAPDATIMDRIAPAIPSPHAPARPAAEITARHPVEEETLPVIGPAAHVREPEPEEPPEPVAPPKPKPAIEGRRGLPWPLIGAAAAVLVVIAILVTVIGGRDDAGPGRQGTLVINALPWAEVETIHDESGVQVPLPEQRHTPLSLPLAPGRYRITMRHPGSTDPVLVEAEVVQGRQKDAPLAKFTTLDAAEVLGNYGL